jgi:hypothetical protein
VLEQHPHVVVLVHAAQRLAAQHRRVAVPRQLVLDLLGEHREERVLQLGHDQPDQAGDAFAQPGRPVVAQHVDRGEDQPSGVLVHPGLVVHDATHGADADAGPVRNLGESHLHGATVAIRMPVASDALEKTCSPLPELQTPLLR